MARVNIIYREPVTRTEPPPADGVRSVVAAERRDAGTPRPSVEGDHESADAAPADRARSTDEAGNVQSACVMSACQSACACDRSRAEIWDVLGGHTASF